MIPLLGTIAPGTLLLAVENIESYIRLPDEHCSGDFALRVRDEGMIGDHIIDGDTIIIGGGESAQQGEIVAALIGDEATVRRLDTTFDPPRLLP